MVHGVRLEHLPEGICFPPELASRISYSMEQRKLQFDGFMSKTDFDKLVRLHNDLSYQRALEQLFQKCTFQRSTPAAEHVRRSVAVTGVIAAVVAVMLGAAMLFWRARQAPHDAPTAVQNRALPPEHAVAGR